ncbi:unnamed protein product [Mycena citricolor]|uniref:Uncharacterized protein n=1 Tax=Mycena citricolor TaxID=2018698 RepID=A0AAD2GZC5_9AGAR|nr:unnamed protein product [Mycena citricolor]
MVTALSGSRLWTRRKLVPSFLTTQNQRERYEEFEDTRFEEVRSEFSSFEVGPGEAILMYRHEMVHQATLLWP